RGAKRDTRSTRNGPFLTAFLCLLCFLCSVLLLVGQKLKQTDKHKLASLACSPSVSEPLNQVIRQIGGAHLFLSPFDIVLHAVELDPAAIGVPYRETGAGIAVAGLAHGPGIDEKLSSGFTFHSDELIELIACRLDG